jgi:hypothetical protein
MGYPPDPDPYGRSGPHQQPYQPQPYMPAPSGPQYTPVQYTQVKERGFNPVTFGVHACLWFFLHWWLAILTIGLWLLVAIPVTFIGWRVTRTVPVQHVQQPPQVPPGY